MSDRITRDEIREVTGGQSPGRIWPLTLSELGSLRKFEQKSGMIWCMF